MAGDQPAQADAYAARITVNGKALASRAARRGVAEMWLAGYEAALAQFDGDTGIGSAAWRDGILAAFNDRLASIAARAMDAPGDGGGRARRDTGHSR